MRRAQHRMHQTAGPGTVLAFGRGGYMCLLTVINVGQGDSFVLRPHTSCKFRTKDIFIDLGDGKRDPLEVRSGSNGLMVSLSHAHRDHIGGLARILSHHQTLDELWLPLYFEELLHITDFVLRLRNIEHLKRDFWPLLAARQALSSAQLLHGLAQVCSCTATALYEGARLCRHLTALNPPLSVEEIFGCKPSDLDDFIRTLYERDFDRVRPWFSSQDFYRIRNTVLTEGWSYDVPEVLGQQEPYSPDRRMRFICAFIRAAAEDIDAFIEKPIPSRFTRIYRRLKDTSNNCSIILEYRDPDTSILFTGDAGSKVFTRLAKRHRLQPVEVLKVPHHGSKRNLRARALQKLQPQLAIVSHDNGLFGRQRDPHPSKEIVDLLDRYVQEVHYTNDVIKDSVVVKTAATGSVFDGKIRFWE